MISILQESVHLFSSIRLFLCLTTTLLLLLCFTMLLLPLHVEDPSRIQTSVTRILSPAVASASEPFPSLLPSGVNPRTGVPSCTSTVWTNLQDEHHNPPVPSQDLLEQTPSPAFCSCPRLVRPSHDLSTPHHRSFQLTHNFRPHTRPDPLVLLSPHLSKLKSPLSITLSINSLSMNLWTLMTTPLPQVSQVTDLGPTETVFAECFHAGRKCLSLPHR